MHMINFVSKIDKKYTQRDQFHQFKNLRWLYCKIKTSWDLFATEPNPQGVIMHFSLNRLIRVDYIYIFFCHTFSFLLSTRQAKVLITFSFLLSKREAKVLINNNQLAIVPKILGWDQLWIINRLVKVDQIYFFLSFYFM